MTQKARSVYKVEKRKASKQNGLAFLCVWRLGLPVNGVPTPILVPDDEEGWVAPARCGGVAG
jgi:hypothetical protein